MGHVTLKGGEHNCLNTSRSRLCLGCPGRQPVRRHTRALRDGPPQQGSREGFPPNTLNPQNQENRRDSTVNGGRQLDSARRGLSVGATARVDAHSPCGRCSARVRLALWVAHRVTLARFNRQPRSARNLCACSTRKSWSAPGSRFHCLLSGQGSMVRPPPPRQDQRSGSREVRRIGETPAGPIPFPVPAARCPERSVSGGGTFSKSRPRTAQGKGPRPAVAGAGTHFQESQASVSDSMSLTSTQFPSCVPLRELLVHPESAIKAPPRLSIIVREHCGHPANVAIMHR
jgi:hypothetical protein